MGIIRVLKRIHRDKNRNRKGKKIGDFFQERTTQDEICKYSRFYVCVIANFQDNKVASIKTNSIYWWGFDKVYRIKNQT